MNKIKLFAAVAILATFTLTACDEKTPTPEQVQLAKQQETEKRAMQIINDTSLTDKQRDDKLRKEGVNPMTEFNKKKNEEFQKEIEKALKGVADKQKKVNDSIRKARMK